MRLYAIAVEDDADGHEPFETIGCIFNDYQDAERWLKKTVKEGTGFPTPPHHEDTVGMVIDITSVVEDLAQLIFQPESRWEAFLNQCIEDRVLEGEDDEKELAPEGA